MTSLNTSAMSRVLALPELLSTILDFLQNDGPSLAACMRVNKMWAEEAAKPLWMNCGTWTFIRKGLLKPPPIRHLATLTARNVERLQWYARFIRYISFGTEDFFHDDDLSRVMEEPLYESRYLVYFQGIDFPRLETIEILSSAFVHDIAISLRPFLQPKLKSIVLYGGIVTEKLFPMIKVYYYK